MTKSIVFTLVMALAGATAACGDTSNDSASGGDHKVGVSKQALFSNGDFEGDAINTTPPTGWAVTTYTNPNGVTGSASAPPASFSALKLASSGGKLETYVVGGAQESQVDPDLGAGQAFRYPRFGSRGARINYKDTTEDGHNQNANGLSQTMTITPADIDPIDGQVHVRFAVAPVLENPSHGYTQQPYYYVELLNLTRSTTLYRDFNTAGQSGVPWITTTSARTGNTTQWTNWQLVDLAPSASDLSIGDQVKLTVVGSGCSLGAHFGRVYVDGTGATVPGLYAWATGPTSIPASSTTTASYITYVVHYANGGSSTMTGAHVDMATPPQTTYFSLSGAANCTTPTAGSTGTISCPVGVLAPGSSGTFTVTVRVNNNATGSIVNGNYSIAAVGYSPLLGARVTTQVISSGTRNADAVVTQTANKTSLNWGDSVTYTIVLKNNGPNNLNNSATNQMSFSDLFPPELTGVTWTCSASGATTSCPAASGTGSISGHPRVGSGGGTLTFTVSATVIAGSGSGSVTNTATATPGVRPDPNTSNNSATLTLAIGAPQTLTITKAGSSSSGTVTSAPSGISCGTACSSANATFAEGSTITLTATPSQGASFSGWDGDCSGTSPTCTVTMSAARNVTATFAAAPTAGSASKIFVYAGDGQHARTSTSFGSKLSAFVTDDNGIPINNVTVTYTAVPVGGATASLSGATKTNASGISTVSAAANATPGTYTVTASIDLAGGGTAEATFTLTNVGAPSAITYVSGGTPSDPNRAPVTTAFGAPLMVLVTDAVGTGVPGATVSYSVTPVGGASATLSSATATTDADGHASITATANGTAGAYTATASTSGVVATVTFNLQNTTATPAAVFVVSGDHQDTPTSTAFENDLSVGVTDSLGNALNNVTVTFTAPGSGASLRFSNNSTTITATTNALGIATVTAPTANGTIGAYSVNASVAGVATPATFSLANDGPQVIDAYSGTPQVRPVDSALASLVVLVTSSSTGAPLNNVTVTFSAPSSGATASLSSTTATTNASGFASVTATAGSVAGSYVVTASTAQSGAPATFALTNIAGAATAISVQSGSDQHALRNGDFASGLVAKVVDSHGNPVSGVSVTFTPPASGPTASVVGSPAVTDSSGLASVSVTAGSAAGSYNVVASASGAGSVNFALTTDECQADGDCSSSQFCNTESSSCVNKLSNGTAIPTIAGHTPALSGSCDSGAAGVVCVSGVCDDADDACGYDNGHGSCDSDSASSVCRSQTCSVSGVCMASGSCLVAGDCSLSNATAACSSGTCTIASCDSGFGDCDGAAANGCEVATSSDVNHCGTCSNVCNLAHASESCSSGSCGIASCDSGYGNCNTTVSDGCELLVAGSDASNCGACGTTCASNEYCATGSCTTKKANGQACSAASECLSDICFGDGKCGLPDGSTCSSGSKCRGGACSVSNVCMQSGSCVVDGDCTSDQFCDTALHECEDKLTNGTPLPAIAGHDPALTGACSPSAADVVCVSAVCDTADSKCGHANGEGPCDDASAARVCRSQVCGSDDKCGYPDGEGSCDSGNAAVVCRSGLCESGVCSAPPECNVDSDCESDRFCDTAAHVCSPKLPNGTPLPTLADHTPELDGICSSAVASAVCTAEVCDGSDDRCGYLNAHGPCDSANAASVCRSGVCGSDDLCGYPDGEGSCTGVNASLVCRSGLCSSSSHQCVALGGCSVDADCLSTQFCDTAASSCTAKLPNGHDLPTITGHTPELDGTCSNDAAQAVCSAAVCDVGDDACGYANSHGPCDSSTAGTVCRSGVCGSDDLCGYPNFEGACTTINAATVCRSRNCSLASHVCAPAGGCLYDADCSSAEFCDTENATCTPKLPHGSDVPTIAGHDPVLDGTCTSDAGSAVCAAGVCDTSDDKCGYLNDTGPCDGSSATAVCRSGVCGSDDKCGYPDGEGSCTSANAGLLCRSGSCSSSSHICISAGGCSVDADCSSGQFCNSVTRSCVPKLSLGISLPSIAGHSPALDGTCSAAAGAAVCSAGVCDADDKCGYRNGSGACSAADATTVCRSGVCGGDGKCGLPDGEGACTSTNAGSVCRSGTCSSTSHVCVETGGCAEDADCANTQFCDTAAAACRTKLADGSAVPSIAGHMPALTGACSESVGAAVCRAGVCDASDDKCAFANGSGPCSESDADSVCRSNVCGGDGLCGYADGEGDCTSLNAGEVCRSGNCDESAHSCGSAPVPSGCTSDDECESTQFCDTAAHSCVAKLPAGMPIPSMGDHTPELDGTCTPASGSSVCAAAVCDESDDRCAYGNGNGACDSDNAGLVCRSATCGSDGQCGLPDGEGPCTSSDASMCRSGVCADSVCGPAQGCQASSECEAGQFCDSSTQQCVAKRPANGACSSDEQCESDSCDLAAQRCNQCIGKRCGRVGLAGGGFGCSAVQPGSRGLLSGLAFAIGALLLLGVTRRRRRRGALLALALGTAAAVSGAASSASAQVGQGFSLERYEPSAAGQWSFWVDHPQYSQAFELKAGLTFDYAHHPLVLGIRDGNKFVESKAIVAHQVYGHLDLAATMLDRIELSFSLPAALYQSGTAAAGISPGDPALGDPRVGLMLRLFNDPLHDAFSMHVGARVWIPAGGVDQHTGDKHVRVAPRLVLAGTVAPIQWSFLGEWLYRNEASIGTLPKAAGNSIGSELHLGARVAYADLERGFSVGPEAALATVVSGGKVFGRSYTAVEVLLGAQYKIAHTVLIGLAGGIGAAREPGNPDARAIARFAFAPDPEKKPAPPPAPPSDRDQDGVIDSADACPDLAQGPNPDAARPGCPRLDRDQDGVFDDEDACPDVAGIHTSEPSTNGCPPPPDRDADGVIDAADSCPDTPAGAHPDPDRAGCPLTDRDGDGVFDRDDQCPDLAMGDSPHPTKPGCPTVKENAIVIDPIFFKTGKAEILPESIPVVQTIADIMRDHPEFARVSIEGHTDDQGSKNFNMKLSVRRAAAVMTWLLSHGVAPQRLESHGFGPTRPIADNDSDEGRAKNRRVEFIIIKAK